MRIKEVTRRTDFSCPTKASSAKKRQIGGRKEGAFIVICHILSIECILVTDNDLIHLHLQVAKDLAEEDDLFREFALKEMERFRSKGKSTDLLKKVLIAN